MSTSAMPHMPMPPMPTKWIWVSCLRNMRLLTSRSGTRGGSELFLQPGDDLGGGARPAEGGHGGAHGRQARRVVEQGADGLGELGAVEVGLAEHEGGAGGGQRFRVLF